MYFAPQRCALFRHLNFQKRSKTQVFCTFLLGNLLRATTACNFSSLIWPAGSAPAASASLLFDPPEPQSLEKHSVLRLSYLVAHLHLLSSYSFSSTLLSSNLSLLSASALLCFSSVHIVGSLTSKLPSIIVSVVGIMIYYIYSLFVPLALARHSFWFCQCLCNIHSTNLFQWDCSTPHHTWDTYLTRVCNRYSSKLWSLQWLILWFLLFKPFSFVEVSENGCTHKSFELEHDLVLKPMVLLIPHFKYHPMCFRILRRFLTPKATSTPWPSTAAGIRRDCGWVCWASMFNGGTPKWTVSDAKSHWNGWMGWLDVSVCFLLGNVCCTLS